MIRQSPHFQLCQSVRGRFLHNGQRRQVARDKVVPFVGTLKSGVFTVENASKVTEQLQALIDQHVGSGWEFYSMEKVNIQISPGCLAALFGAKAAFITFDQVIFRRAR